MTTTSYLLIAGAIVVGVIVLFLSRSQRVSNNPMMHNQPFMPDATNVDSEVLNLIAAGRKIQAIKLVRQRTGRGLKEAKDFVDAFEAQGVTMKPWEKAPKPMKKSVSPDVQQQVQDLVRQNQLIQAIKLVREHTGWGLKEAKDYVDQFR